MKLLSTLAVYLVAATTGVIAAEAEAEAARCKGDNCLNAVRNPSRPGLDDCNSYLRTIVGPTPITYTIVTSTRTVSTTVKATSTSYVFEGGSILSKRHAIPDPLPAAKALVTDAPLLVKRAASYTITATATPTYASQCGNTSRYKSACSCIGATSTTVTAPQGYITSYIVSTTTATVTQTVVATQTACISSQNYGFLYGSGYYESKTDLSFDQAIIQEPYYNQNLRYCCQLCYTRQGCLAGYHTAENNCFLLIEGKQAKNPPTPNCPFGIAEAHYSGLDGSGSITGFGPCAKYVGPNDA